MIEVIDNHSVRTDLLVKGPVLDAGARGFVFSKWFAEKGHPVMAYDPSPDIENPHIPGITFKPYALVGSKVTSPKLVMTDDPGAWYVDPVKQGRAVGFTTIETVKDIQWDVIKLNIEGSEYDVLDEWPGPISRQLVVSFHEHTPRARQRSECDRLIHNMRQWYTAFNVVWDKRYCCSENYWDVLFIRNDIV